MIACERGLTQVQLGFQIGLRDIFFEKMTYRFVWIVLSGIVSMFSSNIDLWKVCEGGRLVR